LLSINRNLTSVFYFQTANTRLINSNAKS